MKSKIRLAAGALFIALVFTLLSSGCAKHPKPAFTAGELISATAKVVAIDYPARRLALQGPEGNVVMIAVGEDAYNFDQIAVGDMVDITYTRSVAVSLQKPTGEPSAISGTGMTRAPKGQKPEGLISNAMEITARVEDIDYANRLVEIRGPYGNLIEVEVDEDVENFDNVKKGDDVVVRYIEAVAIAVRQAAKTE
ncbi:MAG: hypothetical protein WA081_07640 [Desulfosalsimonadaceae bacterium]